MQCERCQYDASKLRSPYECDGTAAMTVRQRDVGWQADASRGDQWMTDGDACHPNCFQLCHAPPWHHMVVGRTQRSCPHQARVHRISARRWGWTKWHALWLQVAIQWHCHYGRTGCWCLQQWACPTRCERKEVAFIPIIINRGVIALGGCRGTHAGGLSQWCSC